MSKNKWVKNPDVRSSESNTNTSRDCDCPTHKPYNTEWLTRAAQNKFKETIFSYPFSICPLHFTGRGFSISKDEAKNLYTNEIKVISYAEFKDSTIPPLNLFKATALEWEDITGRKASLQYEIINKSFCEFLYFIETKRWQSGFHDKYTEQLFSDLRNGNIKIGLSLRVYCDSRLSYQDISRIEKAKVFCKLWK